MNDLIAEKSFKGVVNLVNHVRSGHRSSVVEERLATALSGQRTRGVRGRHGRAVNL